MTSNKTGKKSLLVTVFRRDNNVASNSKLNYFGYNNFFNTKLSSVLLIHL